MRRLGLQHGVDRNGLGGLRDLLVIGNDKAGLDRRLRPRTALEQAAFDQQDIGAFAGRGHESGKRLFVMVAAAQMSPRQRNRSLHERSDMQGPSRVSLALSRTTFCPLVAQFVGWAKRSVPTVTVNMSNGGHAALCPPYGPHFVSSRSAASLTHAS